MMTKELQVPHLMFKKMKQLLQYIINVVITFFVLSCNQQISFKEIELDVTNLTKTAIVADGVAAYEVSAKVNPQVKDEFRTITFKCNEGEFVGEGDKKLRAVRVNSDGKASIFWKVPSQGGDYYLSASIGKDNSLFKDEKKVTLSQQNVPMPTLTVSIKNPQAIANGVDSTKIEITSSNAANKSIKIETSEGTINDGLTSQTKTFMTSLDKDGKKSIFLQLANKVTKYFVKVSLTETPDITDTKDFTPKRAAPDTIIIESNAATAALKTPISLEIFLRRSKGKVSEDTPITIEAYQRDNPTQLRKVGRFKGVSSLISDSNGKITLSFHTDTNDIDVNFPVIITATAKNNQNKEIKTEIKLTLTK